jgi:hypothetical protein
MRMTGSVRPRTASLLAGCAGALALTATLSACKSATTVNPGGPNVQSSASVSVAAPSPAGSPTSAAAPSATTPAGSAGAVSTPKQVLTAVPAGARLVPFLSASTSADGRTVFVQVESMGGACGQYDVVLQQSSTQVGVGLVHLSAGGHICPQFVGPLRIPVSLDAPLSGRPVLDLANGQRLNVG